MALSSEFIEEIDHFVTQEAEVTKVETESSEPTDMEEDAANDPSSETLQDEQTTEVAKDDPDAGDPVTETHEDGAEGDTDETKVTESEEHAASVISDYAMARAADVGISQEHAKEFSSGAELLAEVRHLEDSAVTASRHEQPETTASESIPDPLADLPDLNPEEYDPKVIEMFEGLRSAIKAQSEEISNMHKTQMLSEHQNQEAAAREVTQWFDSEINGLDMPETLGEGSHGDLAQGSSQLAKRNEIASQAAVLLAGYEASGQPAPSREEIFRASARLVLSDEYQALYEKEITTSLKKQGSQHISRASGKKTKSKQSPTDEIAALINEKFPE